MAPADLSSPAVKPFAPNAQKSFSASQQSAHPMFRKNSCGAGERIWIGIEEHPRPHVKQQRVVFGKVFRFPPSVSSLLQIAFKKSWLKDAVPFFKAIFYMMYFDQILFSLQLFLDSFYLPTHSTSCSVLDTSFENIFTGQFHALPELNNMPLLLHFCCSSILSNFISD